MDIIMPIFPGNKPSKVCEIMVTVGSAVKNGDPIVSVESTKGVRIVKSNVDGIVDSINIKLGDMVSGKDLLMTITEGLVSETEAILTEVIMPIFPGNKPSKVCEIMVSNGDTVKTGDSLVSVESTKGVRLVKSTVDGIVDSIYVKLGDMVSGKDLLFKIKESSSNEEKNDKAEDLVIIGGGPGGYVAAIYASKKGKKVTLIEEVRLGGTCLNVGCIPTKSIIKSSEVYHHIVNSEEFGLELATTSKVNLARVVERKNGIVDTLVGGIEGLMDKNNITVIKGTAKFVNSKSVIVGDLVIEFKDCIIATGSKIARPGFIKGIDSEFVLDSTQALNLCKLPSTLAIIGGGVIGMEFAFLMRGFGVDVSVIEFADHLLGFTDSDLVETITKIAKERGIKLYLSGQVSECESTPDGGIVHFKQDGEMKSIACEKALLAFGRVTCIDNIGLDKAGVQLTERKNAIQVDDTMKTNVDNIYAIGDVNGLIQLAHAASHQGILAVNNILGHKEKFVVSNVPSVIFTSPEIATVGISEDAAKQNGINYKVGKFNFQSNGKAQAMGEAVGFVKLLSDQTDTVIGGSVIGPDAGTLIATITLAVQNKLKVSQITDTIFAHPTTAESIHEAAMGLGIGTLHE